MPALAPVPPLPKVTVPLNSLIPPLYRHYFNRYPDRPNYLMRRYDFPGDLGFLPLVRAFLDTCAAAQSADYRYLFTLLGSELAGNAVEHTRSGKPGGTYSLLVRRHTDALTLTCQDEGTVAPFIPAPRPAELSAYPLGTDADSGRGLALVDALSTAWGDNGRADHRHVWFRLDYDLTDNPWTTS